MTRPRLLLPGSLVAAPTIALLVTLASLFGYVTTNYFLAQLLVMPLVLGELLVLHWIAGQSDWRERLGGLVLLAGHRRGRTLELLAPAVLDAAGDPRRGLHR